MFRELIRASNIKAIDVIYNKKEYPARTIDCADAPDWYYRQENTKTVERQFDRKFDLVMCTSQLALDIDSRMACQGQVGAQYANAIIISKTGERAVIKDASLLYFKGLEITLLGGVFMFAGNDELLTQREKNNHEKRLRLIESEKPDLARFRHILEE